jgi:hypothetical protein
MTTDGSDAYRMAMTEPRTYSYGDPEPGPDVDAVNIIDNITGDLETWWRFGDRWRCTALPAPMTWRGLSFLGELTEVLPEHEYTQGDEIVPDLSVPDYFKTGGNHG